MKLTDLQFAVYLLEGIIAGTAISHFGHKLHAKMWQIMLVAMIAGLGLGYFMVRYLFHLR